MVRKESAMKSGKKVGDQSASDAPIVIPFAINPKYPHFWKMNFLPERGYDMKEAHPDFEATVQALKWEGFVQHRTYYLEQIVREFYAGLLNKAEGVQKQYSLVRGKKIFFDEETINKHYNLQYSGNAFDEKYESYGKKRMEQIKNRIAIPSAEWDKFTNREFKLKIRYIIPELSNWHMFINCSIMPTSHNYTLPKDRLIILDSIFTEDEINIGRIINKEIRDCAKKTEGYLFFPCLITALCLKQKVHVTDDERNQRKFPPAALSAQMKARRVFKGIEELKEKGKKKVEAPEVDDKKQKALMKYLWEQHEWLELKLANVEPTNLEIPQFPIWLLDNIVEEEEDSEKEKSEDKEEPPTKKKNLKRKKETQRKGKGKKKVTEEIIVSDDEEETEEEEELQEEVKRMEKETDEEYDDTATEGSEDKEKDDFDLGLSLEELLQKTKGKTPISEQQTPTNQPTTKSPSPPPSEPPSTGTTPPPLDKADVIQKEPTKEAPQTKNPPKEKTPPILDETIFSANISVETGARQDLNVSPTKEATEEETPAKATGVSAPGASAPDSAAPTVIQMSDDPQTTMNIVAMELALKKKEIAEKKKADVIQKEAKKQGEGVSEEKEIEKAAKDKEEEAKLRDVAETLKDLPASAVKGTEEKSAGEGTPKPSKSAALKTGASASKATGSSKKKPKPTPTRSSARIRSGVKPQ